MFELGKWGAKPDDCHCRCSCTCTCTFRQQNRLLHFSFAFFFLLGSCARGQPVQQQQQFAAADDSSSSLQQQLMSTSRHSNSNSSSDLMLLLLCLLLLVLSSTVTAACHLQFHLNLSANISLCLCFPSLCQFCVLWPLGDLGSSVVAATVSGSTLKSTATATARSAFSLPLSAVQTNRIRRVMATCWLPWLQNKH